MGLLEQPQPIYRRVLLKLSGEFLQGNLDFGIDPDLLTRFAAELKELVRLSVQIGIVIGAGNIFRGTKLSTVGIDRITGDHMGMLATVMNAIALRDALEKYLIPTRVMSAIPISGLVGHYDRRKAIYHLQENRIVIFAGGTGNPLVTTDSAASLRGIEIGAEVLLKGTHVEGVYSTDPKRDPKAKLIKHLSFKEALDRELGVMDLSAFCQCRDHNLPIRVFNINKSGVLLRVVTSLDEGTLVD